MATIHMVPLGGPKLVGQVVPRSNARPGIAASIPDHTSIAIRNQLSSLRKVIQSKKIWSGKRFHPSGLETLAFNSQAPMILGPKAFLRLPNSTSHLRVPKWYQPNGCVRKNDHFRLPSPVWAYLMAWPSTKSNICASPSKHKIVARNQFPLWTWMAYYSIHPSPMKVPTPRLWISGLKGCRSTRSLIWNHPGCQPFMSSLQWILSNATFKKYITPLTSLNTKVIIHPKGCKRLDYFEISCGIDMPLGHWCLLINCSAHCMLHSCLSENIICFTVFPTKGGHALSQWVKIGTKKTFKVANFQQIWGFGHRLNWCIDTRL